MSKPQNVTLGGGIQVGVLPLFCGHHAVWAGETTQADICNNADDFVVLDCTTGRKHRFPITDAFLPWLRRLIDMMEHCDWTAGHPWGGHNTSVREVLFDAASRVVNGSPPQLNILNPPLISPALDAYGAEIDSAILSRVAEHPESLIA